MTWTSTGAGLLQLYYYIHVCYCKRECIIVLSEMFRDAYYHCYVLSLLLFKWNCNFYGNDVTLMYLLKCMHHVLVQGDGYCTKLLYFSTEKHCGFYSLCYTRDEFSGGGRSCDNFWWSSMHPQFHFCLSWESKHLLGYVLMHVRFLRILCEWRNVRRTHNVLFETWPRICLFSGQSN